MKLLSKPMIGAVQALSRQEKETLMLQMIRDKKHEVDIVKILPEISMVVGDQITASSLVAFGKQFCDDQSLLAKGNHLKNQLFNTKKDLFHMMGRMAHYSPEAFRTIFSLMMKKKCTTMMTTMMPLMSKIMPLMLSELTSADEEHGKDRHIHDIKQCMAEMVPHCVETCRDQLQPEQKEAIRQQL
ncbi:MAG: hypothetical protein D6B25_03145 [Desulfobulbaceae bacterium]|nr:MAG: hypothetical protein D6B25_03145 [Desulfobulbaceae bacterium]